MIPLRSDREVSGRRVTPRNTAAEQLHSLGAVFMLFSSNSLVQIHPSQTLHSSIGELFLRKVPSSHTDEEKRSIDQHHVSFPKLPSLKQPPILSLKSSANIDCPAQKSTSQRAFDSERGDENPDNYISTTNLPKAIFTKRIIYGSQ